MDGEISGYGHVCKNDVMLCGEYVYWLIHGDMLK